MRATPFFVNVTAVLARTIGPGMARKLARQFLYESDLPVIRSELVTKLATDYPGLAVRDIDAIVECFFDEIVEQLADGGRIELRGFGTFSTRARVARTGRNPRTGDAVDVQAKRVPYFKPGKEMRERLNV